MRKLYVVSILLVLLGSNVSAASRTHAVTSCPSGYSAVSNLALDEDGDYYLAGPIGTYCVGSERLSDWSGIHFFYRDAAGRQYLDTSSGYNGVGDCDDRNIFVYRSVSGFEDSNYDGVPDSALGTACVGNHSFVNGRRYYARQSGSAPGVSTWLDARDALVSPARRRAVNPPTVLVLELSAPFQVGFDYGDGEKYLLTGLEDGTLWWVLFAPNALGHVWPEAQLDVSRIAGAIVIRWPSGQLEGIRFNPQSEWGYRPKYEPFDPLVRGASGLDLFIPGTEVRQVFLDCPAWGVPNNPEVISSITAYRHVRHYVVIEPKGWVVGRTAETTGTPMDNSYGYRFLLVDHYEDELGRSYMPVSQALRDDAGNVIVWNDSRRICGVIE